MEPEKSSIGEISSKTSSRPEVSGTSSRPASMDSWTLSCQASLPISQSKDCVCRARRSGTSRGSTILANEMREAEREPRSRRGCQVISVSPRLRAAPAGYVSEFSL
jgi:hypothetical protein